MTATEDDGKLRLFINGRRFIARGGNWGFGESMLRYRAANTTPLFVTTASRTSP